MYLLSPRLSSTVFANEKPHNHTLALNATLDLAGLTPLDRNPAALSVYRTDEQGAVEIISDGARVWVETER